ncbi:MAG: peptidoglycan DD-metalloendopeptidase family protein [Vicingus serpentipes]|nr:peptidoglycan DD-metalloendopeptidase family protein [Vicingus serpentipes]
MEVFIALFLWAIMKKYFFLLFGGVGIVILLFLLKTTFITGTEQDNFDSRGVEDTAYVSTVEYGIETDSFTVYRDVIQPNEFLANILLKYKIPYPQIDALAKESREIFDVRKMAAGKNYTILCSKDSLGKAQCFIYEPNATDYVVFDMRDTLTIYKGQKEVETRIKTASGIIQSSLYQTLVNAKVSPILAIEMANVYAWTIDFYRIQKNDWFKVVYEERFIDGESIGVGRVLSANFNHQGKDFFACYFVQDSIGDYFDTEANSLRRAFLKSPLKYGRLTSGFTMRRFHPVQKRNKPHLGTDYAAPTGTPILATGDGVVIASAYAKFNGNYVKIRHNSTYTTQYLHMSKRRAKVGQHVTQGDVIGYVGSTGLATGPHVCYRFWKNGSQTNHLREDFPPSKPVNPENKAAYQTTLEQYKAQLRKVRLKGKAQLKS